MGARLLLKMGRRREALVGDRALLPSFWVKFTMLSYQVDSITDAPRQRPAVRGTSAESEVTSFMSMSSEVEGPGGSPASGDTQEAGAVAGVPQHL